jgi:hypothetical protein
MIIDTDTLETTRITTELVEAFEALREHIDGRVSDVFHDWCEAAGKHAAYGVESWDWGWKTVTIVQDTSCMGCYSNDSHMFPVEWFLTSREESRKLIKAHLDFEKADARELRLTSRKKQLEELRKKTAQLAAELGEE